MTFEEILNAAVDAGWEHKTSPQSSFCGAFRVAARKAIELYKEHIEREKERQCKLLDRIAELEKFMNLVGSSVGTVEQDRKLPSHELGRILADVHLRMSERTEATNLAVQVSEENIRVAENIAKALRLLDNREQLRKRFRQEAHWIRFIRDVRLLLQDA